MRYYDGCPDSELKTYLDDQAEIRRQIAALGYSVTWFPEGEFYQAFKDYKAASQEHKTLSGVLVEIRNTNERTS